MDIIPNLVPVVLSLLVWLLGQQSRPLARGAQWALIITSIMALPPLVLAASEGFGSLGMAFMLTLIMAMASSVFGLVAFLVGYFSARRVKSSAP